MTLFQNMENAPQSFQLVPSGDYKSVDPAAMDIVLPEHAAGVRVNLNVTAASGGGGVTVTIQGYDEGSGTYYTLLASALKTGAAFTQLLVDPRIAASANLIAQLSPSKKVRVICVGSSTRTTLTYSVGVDILS